MTDNLVTRLREAAMSTRSAERTVCDEAAEEIERLREALREVMDLSHRRTTHPMSDEADYYRIARAALGEEK